MVSERKVEIVETLTEEIDDSRDLVFTNYKGLTVDEMETLRQDLYEEQSRMRVVKNRLAERAFQNVFSENGDESSDGTATEASPDSELELGDISGLGPSKVEALNEEGFDSVQSVAEASVDDLAEVSGIGDATAEKFKDGAQSLLSESGGSEETQDGNGTANGEADAGELMDHLDDMLTGNTAIALSGDAYVNMAEILVDFAEEHEELQIKGGLLNGGFLEPDDVESVSELPSRRELLTTLAGTLQKPLQDLVHHLKYPLQSLVRTLNELKEEKESSS
jgi:ribosomal protein L10